MATPAEEYAAFLNHKLGSLPRGSLRFWGVWFGRPYDNSHSIVEAEGQSDLLRIRFDCGELLSVWSPGGLEASATIFQISDAERVRWEWHPYGTSSASEKLCFEEFRKGHRGVSNSTPSEYLMPLPGSPAIELLSVTLPKLKMFSRLTQILRFFRARSVQ